MIKEGIMKVRDSMFVLAVVLAAVAGAFMVNFQGTPAMAQGKADAGGMIAVPFHVSPGQQGLCLIDTRNGVMCVYDVNVRGKYSIELVGARNYTYDVRIPKLNTGPDPNDVKAQIKKIEDARRKKEGG